MPVDQTIILGGRPNELTRTLDAEDLKKRLQNAETRALVHSDFVIAHRGAPFAYPEHTRESYKAARRQGAGIIEADVTFTRDGALVVRHAQCDLHDTTDILESDLAERCREPFQPAEFDSATGELLNPATAQCCTTDLTVSEFQSLRGRMAGHNPAARTVDEYLQGNPDWRGNALPEGGTLMTLAEQIDLLESLGAKHIPELKAADTESVIRVFGSQGNYAQALVDAYRNAGVEPANVFLQSFNLADISYWIEQEPEYGKQAVFLIGKAPEDPARLLSELKALGVNILAPPIPMLLTLDTKTQIVPSAFAHAIRKADFDIIAWTLERSPPASYSNENGQTDFYFQTIQPALQNDGDIYHALDVLAVDVGIRGIFTDWPATVTLYANTMNR